MSENSENRGNSYQEYLRRSRPSLTAFFVFLLCLGLVKLVLVWTGVTIFDQATNAIDFSEVGELFEDLEPDKSAIKKLQEPAKKENVYDF